MVTEKSLNKLAYFRLGVGHSIGGLCRICEIGYKQAVAQIHFPGICAEGFPSPGPWGLVIKGVGFGRQPA